MPIPPPAHYISCPLQPHLLYLQEGVEAALRVPGDLGGGGRAGGQHRALAGLPQGAGQGRGQQPGLVH